ncbi:MAG: DUF3108 domain-containing protein [Bdellovibrionota bacterium]
MHKIPRLVFKISTAWFLAFLFTPNAYCENSRYLKELQLGKLEPEINVQEGPFNDALPDLSKLPFQIPELVSMDAYHETFMSRILGGHCHAAIEKLVKIQGRWALKFALRAKSADWYKWIIVIKENIEGYFDLESGKTLYLNVDKQEGSYHQRKTVLFDYDNRRVVEKESEGDTKIHYRQYELDEYVVDSYSILFLIRRQNLFRTKDIFYNIYSNGKVYHLKASVLGQKNIELSNKKIKTHKVEILTKVEGALAQRKGIFMYFSADKGQLPLYSEADVKVGAFTLEARPIPVTMKN